MYLNNSQGRTGPYYVLINIIDTPPEFIGKMVETKIAEIRVKVREVYYL